jgi:hypothetical protein
MVKILSPIDLMTHKNDEHAFQNVNSVNPPKKGPKYMDIQCSVGAPVYSS